MQTQQVTAVKPTTRWSAGFIWATVASTALFALLAFVMIVWLVFFASMGLPCTGTNSCDFALGQIGNWLMMAGAPLLLLVTLGMSIVIHRRGREIWLVWLLGFVALIVLYAVSYWIAGTGIGFV